MISDTSLLFRHVQKFVLVYLVAAAYFLKELFLRAKGWVIEKKLQAYPKQENKVAVITGGSQGIGLETVRQLLTLGVQVIVGSSNPKKSSAVQNRLQKEFPKAKVEFWLLDLRSMDSVKKFAQRILDSNMPVHLLICNAGVMFEPYVITEDGFESHICINYLSHCLLTALLLPRLKESGTDACKARIINVSSCAHKAGEIDFNDLHSRKMYSAYHGYSQSKLAQIMFTFALSRYLKSQQFPVTVNCLHPGIVDTNLYKNVWWAPVVSGLLFKTPEEGTETTLYAALSNDMEEISGEYLEECAISHGSKFSGNVDFQERLWKNTWEQLRPWVTSL